MIQLSCPYMINEKTVALNIQTLLSRVASLHFNVLTRFFIAFLQRSKHLLISWLQSPSAVILEPRKIKSLTVFIVSPSICREVMGLHAMIVAFWMLSFKPLLSLFSFTFIKRLFQSVSQSVTSVAQSCPTLYDPMNHSMPGLPVHNQLPEFTQTHVHWVGDAIQPSHPLLSPFLPAPNPFQHRSLFQWVSSLHEVARVLEFQL